MQSRWGIKGAMDDLFSYKSLVHALSGMAGGATAITVFCAFLPDDRPSLLVLTRCL